MTWTGAPRNIRSGGLAYAAAKASGGRFNGLGASAQSNQTTRRPELHWLGVEPIQPTTHAASHNAPPRIKLMNREDGHDQAFRKVDVAGNGTGRDCSSRSARLPAGHSILRLRRQWPLRRNWSRQEV
jgi:hypothetical protein